MDYYEHPGVSQSKLKLLLSHPSLFNSVQDPEYYFSEKKHFVIGSAVDYCLTNPFAEFSDEYHISNLENKPTDVIKSIINMVFDTQLAVREIPIENIRLISDIDYREDILEACVIHDYHSSLKDQTRINKVCEHYEYWEDLKEAYGKTILSQDEANLIDEIVMSLRTSTTTSKYFNASNVKFQVPIYFEYKDIECKALLDMIIIDEEKKTILPIDLKTMGDYTINFPKSLRRRRYDIQAAFYTEALKWLYPEYTILPFKFIVESTKQPGTPLVFTCTRELLEIGKSGRPEIFLVDDAGVYYDKVQKIKGFDDLIELYIYYSTNGFELDQVVRDNNSELTIDWSGIIV